MNIYKLVELVESFKDVCEVCFNKQWNLHKHSYYLSPFNSKPYSFEVCNKCNEYIENNGFENVYMCDGCYREIAYNSGMRQNLRYDENDECYYCVQCLQKEWLKNGMNKFKDADFMDYSKLQEHGFNKHNDYFCRSNESYKQVEKIFNKLQENHKVIVDIQSSGLGFEHYIGLWIKS